MEVSREEKLEQLERVLHSQTLHSADSLRGFLRFAAGKVIDRQESQLKEYVIATEVFGRNDDFDRLLTDRVILTVIELVANREAVLLLAFGRRDLDPSFIVADASHFANAKRGAKSVLLFDSRPFDRLNKWQRRTVAAHRIFI